MKTQTLDQCMALERILPYGLRVAARNEFPAGKSYDFDLRLRIQGTVSKDAADAPTPKPAIDTVLCKSVLAAAAETLGRQPTQLATAIQDAARSHTGNGKFVGDDVVDRENPFVQALDLVDETHIPTLRTKGESRANSVVVRGQRPNFYASSVIKPS